MSRRQSTYFKKRKRDYFSGPHDLLLETETNNMNGSIYRDRPDLDAVKARMVLQEIEGEPLKCVIRRRSQQMRTYWIRAYAVELPDGRFRVYSTVREGLQIYSPKWWIGTWPDRRGGGG